MPKRKKISIASEESSKDGSESSKRRKSYLDPDFNLPGYSQVVSKPKCKSLVWRYFGLPADENGKIVRDNCSICKICNYYVSNSGGTTSNMIAHLKSHHKSKYREMTKQSKNIANSSRNGVSDEEDPGSSFGSMEEVNVQFALDPLNDSNIETHIKKEILSSVHEDDLESLDSITESITKFLACTMQPWDVVKKTPFISMIESLNPSYKFPEKEYFIKTGVPKLYNETLNSMKLEMTSHINESLTITFDSWTCMSDSQYFAITAHFIDQQWNLKSVYLNCASLEVNYARESLDHALMVILSDWGFNIKNIMCCTMTDKHSKVLKVVDGLSTKLHHIPCFGDSINTAVNKALEIPPLKMTVKKLIQLQNAISLSNNMKHDVVTALQQDVQDLPTVFPNFWRSKLELIRWFLSNQLVVSNWLQDDPDKTHLVLNTGDVSVLEDFVSCTKLLDGITTTLCGDEYVSASSVLPLLGKIKKNLQCEASDSALSQQIKSKILAAVSKPYEEEMVQQDLWMASLCDPRFRLTFTDNAECIKKIAIESMARYYTSDNSSDEQSSRGKEGLEAFFDVNESDADSPEQKAESELHFYLTMNKVSWNSSPLNWWKQHEDSFPALKMIVKKYLAIQGSSVPAERIFGMEGDRVMRQRAALFQENCEMQFFLTENYDSIPKGAGSNS